MGITDSPYRLYAKYVMKKIYEELNHQGGYSYVGAVLFVQENISKAREAARRMPKGETSTNVKAVLLEMARKQLASDLDAVLGKK
jgi:hypothetical protein